MPGKRSLTEQLQLPQRKSPTSPNVSAESDSPARTVSTRARPKIGSTMGPAKSSGVCVAPSRMRSNCRSAGSWRATRSIVSAIRRGRGLWGGPVPSSGGSASDFCILARVVCRRVAAAWSALACPLSMSRKTAESPASSRRTISRRSGESTSGRRSTPSSGPDQIGWGPSSPGGNRASKGKAAPAGGRQGGSGAASSAARPAASPAADCASGPGSLPLPGSGAAPGDLPVPCAAPAMRQCRLSAMRQCRLPPGLWCSLPGWQIPGCRRTTSPARRPSSWPCPTAGRGERPPGDRASPRCVPGRNGRPARRRPGPRGRLPHRLRPSGPPAPPESGRTIEPVPLSPP